MKMNLSPDEAFNEEATLAHIMRRTKDVDYFCVEKLNARLAM